MQTGRKLFPRVAGNTKAAAAGGFNNYHISYIHFDLITASKFHLLATGPFHLVSPDRAI